MMTLKLHHCALVLSGLLAIKTQAANDPTPSPVMVSEVTFSQGTALTNDDGSPMPAPQWEDKVSNTDRNDSFPDGTPDKVAGTINTPNNMKSYAYSYVSNGKPMVAATFKWKGTPDGSKAPYKAKGKVDNTNNSNFELPEQVLGGNTTYAAIVASTNVVTTRLIQAYVTPNRNIVRNGASGLTPLTIEWTVTNKDGTVIGTSKSTHTIYVTWDEPTTTLRQETLFNLACETANGMPFAAAAPGSPVGKAVFLKIWDDFADARVLRMNGDALKFWEAASFSVNLDSADELLRTGDGPCGRWSTFLNESPKVHGVAPTTRSGIAPKPRNVSGLTPTTMSLVIKTYTTTATAPLPKSITLSQLSRSAHKPAQGNLTPSADIFVNHAVVRISGEPAIYDPSYAFPAAGLDSWEANALSYIVGKYASPSVPGSFAYVLFPVNGGTEECGIVDIP